MNKKNVLAVLFMSLLAFGVLINAIISVRSSGTPSPSQGEYASLHFSPESVSDLGVGETFTVTVAVSGLAGQNLYGFDVNFTWDTNAVQYVSHEAKVPVETHVGGVLHESTVEIMNRVDVSAGTLWLAYASLLPALPYNQDGAIFTITFVLIQPSQNPYTLEHAILVNNSGDIIPQNGSQNPEAPSSPPGSRELSLSQLFRNAKWLEWWTHIHQSGAIRRPTAVAP